MSSSSTASCSESSSEDETTASEASDSSSDEGSQTSYIDSDLQDLYDSFDYQDEATGHATSHALGSRSLYSEARLTSLQSSLLLFKYAIRHSLTTKAFTELLQLLSVHVPEGAAVYTNSSRGLFKHFLKRKQNVFATAPTATD